MSWNGVKKQSNIENIKAWCEEMGIQNYTINSQGEIDVDNSVFLDNGNFKELPYKFGKVNNIFSVYNNENLTSLKNCPNFVGNIFSCSSCPQLDSLEGCPKEVSGNFYCDKCKREFNKEEVRSLCNVKGSVIV